MSLDGATSDAPSWTVRRHLRMLQALRSPALRKPRNIVSAGISPALGSVPSNVYQQPGRCCSTNWILGGHLFFCLLGAWWSWASFIPSGLIPQMNKWPLPQVDRDAMYATRGPAPPSCLAHLPGLTLHCLEFTSLYFPAQGRAVLPGPLAPGPGHMTSSSQWVISKIIGTPAWLGQRAASMGIFQNSLLPLTWPSGSQPAQKYKGCPAKFELHVNMPFQILHESYLY